MHATRNQVDGDLSDEAEQYATMQTDERLQPSLASTQQRSYYVTWRRRCVKLWTVCGQQETSMCSLWKCVGSNPYDILTYVGRLNTATVTR